MPLAEGWGWPGAARKAHYFEEGETISLCGRWMFAGPRDTNRGGTSPDDCVECKRRLAKIGVPNAD